MLVKAAATFELAATLGLFGLAALSTTLTFVGGWLLFEVFQASDLLSVLSVLQ